MANSATGYEFTIVVPLFNERENLPQLEKRLSDYLTVCSAKPACVLFVDDGSTDGGAGILKEMCSHHEDFFFVSFEHNRGLSAALKAGIDLCTSPLMGYIDADLQTDPEDFELLLPLAAEHQLVTGIRAKRNDGFVKRASSKVANAFRRRMTGDTAVDTGCPLKVMQVACARKIPFFTGMHRFLPASVDMVGGTYAQVPVRHFPRTAGKAKYHLSNRLWGPLNDCFAFRWMRSRYIEYNLKDSNL